MRRERLERIYVVGFMGSGKTTVGALLAHEMAYRFVDLDETIERERGLSVPEIFEREGEPAFRRLEAAALRSAGAHRETVIATGGGTLTRWENREFIRSTGLSVWLDAPLDVMLERCRGTAHRPLLGPRERMEALLAERVDAYRSSDLRADAGDRPPAAVARWIAAQIGAMA